MNDIGAFKPQQETVMNALNHQTVKRTLSMISFALAAVGACSSANAAHLQTTVESNASKYYTYTASRGETFRVEIDGDDDTDLDLFIRNPSGNTVCVGDGYGDEESCTVYSPNGGRYRIQLKNLGDIYNIADLWVD